METNTKMAFLTFALSIGFASTSFGQTLTNGVIRERVKKSDVPPPARISAPDVIHDKVDKTKPVRESSLNTQYLEKKPAPVVKHNVSDSKGK